MGRQLTTYSWNGYGEASGMSIVICTHQLTANNSTGSRNNGSRIYNTDHRHKAFDEKLPEKVFLRPNAQAPEAA